ncbi:MAG: hypothetical protein H7A12_14710 [Pseudomonadales bacterium]|nr:hypothetical protein [Pseudomonadales bacterium]MCP5322050.1 hypothetical protein [Pseudomonadales bacterium]MCP5338107.1 hypothetical protein [Pseudomonadales bacterium]
MLLTIALSNAALTTVFLVMAISARRLVAIPLLLMSYFSWLFVLPAYNGEVSWVQGFTGVRYRAGYGDILNTLLFAAGFNVLFGVIDILLSRLVAKRSEVDWVLPSHGRVPQVTLIILAVYWVFGVVMYYQSSRGLGYRDYVEGQSNWPLVFLWASAPLIVFLSIAGRYILAGACVLPFLLFAFQFQVRSFALLSLVPFAFVVVMRSALRARQVIGRMRVALVAVAAGLLLMATSSLVKYTVSGRISLPDAGMPYGVVQAMAMVDRERVRLGADALFLYGYNYVSPLLKLTGVAKPGIVDPPVRIAQLLDGVPRGWPVYFHYPTLVWSDAYIAWGFAGVFMGAFWAVVFAGWALALRANRLLAALTFPFYIWHSYMVVRGATAIASVPLSYAAYLSLAALLFGMVLTAWVRQEPLNPRQAAARKFVAGSRSQSGRRV